MAQYPRALTEAQTQCHTLPNVSRVLIWAGRTHDSVSHYCISRALQGNGHALSHIHCAVLIKIFPKLLPNLKKIEYLGG